MIYSSVKKCIRYQRSNKNICTDVHVHVHITKIVKKKETTVLSKQHHFLENDVEKYYQCQYFLGVFGTSQQPRAVYSPRELGKTREGYWPIDQGSISQRVRTSPNLVLRDIQIAWIVLS